ncbi:SpoIIE family protein phosphatase [Patescibacteria group bacterium]|nr:SpoIIE family protein phosphatase [Patescibacteria group bacterium]
MYSIKTKLVAAITLLIVGLFSLAAYLLIKEKQKELTSDIFFETRSFSELTAGQIVDDYELYLAQKGFIYFNREMAGIFQKTQNIDLIQVFDYKGIKLYDSKEESSKQYGGEDRTVTDQRLITQIKAHNPSMLTQNGELFYLKANDDGTINYVNEYESPIDAPEILSRINYFVYPTGDKYAVLYYANYEQLEAALRGDAMRIVFLALLGTVAGLILALVLAGRITKPIAKLVTSSRIIAKGDFKHRVSIDTKDELEILGGAFNQMAEDLDKSTKALVYKERVTKELELAKKIQDELIPKVVPKLAGLEISAGIVPAEEIGGDVYDFLKRDDKNTMFYVGDVTGHGVPSGIVGSVANAMFFSQISNPSLKDIIINVNKVLKAKSPSNMFLTLCLLNWNEEFAKLTYVNAGHEQMIKYSAATKQVELIKAGGIALGMFPDISKMVEEREIQLAVGDSIVIYSDGIPEAWRSQHESYGMEKFKAAVQKFGTLENATVIRNSILKDVKAYMGDYKQMDDITIMIVKRID